MRVKWIEDKCIKCNVCVKACRAEAIAFFDDKIIVDENKCNFCGRCAKACPTDAWDTVSGFIVSFGGLFGNNIARGEPIIPFIEDHDKLIKVCDAAIQFFDDNANPSERFKFTLDRVGREKFEEVIIAAYNE